MNALKFFWNFLRHPTATGAVAPSSDSLARQITHAAQLAGAKIIVEFGTGTGVFSEKILEQMPPEARFLALELNPEFVEATRRRCPRAEVVLDSAVNAKKHLERIGCATCDRIISGLPWASFPEELQDALLSTIQDILSADGLFLTFAYVQGLWLPAGRRFRRKLNSRFHQVATSPIVWMNLPPALVYAAKQPSSPHTPEHANHSTTRTQFSPP